MSLSGITVMNVGLVSDPLFLCQLRSLFLISAGEMLSRTRKAFLEDGSGFHSNAFKSGGETQLHKPWEGCGTAGKGHGVWS